MRQCCMTCQHKGFDVTALCPRCTKGVIDIPAAFGLNSVESHVAYDLIPELRDGTVVQIGSKFFEIIPSFEEREEYHAHVTDDDEIAPIDEGQLAVAWEQFRAGHPELETDFDEDPTLESEREDVVVVRLDTMSETEQARAMREAVALSQGIYDPEADRNPEDVVMRPQKGNRFGFHYKFRGFSIVQAFVEPFLWEFGCEHGVHKFTKQPFFDWRTPALTERSEASPAVKPLAKALWAESMLKQMEAEGITPDVCPECGAPVYPDMADVPCQWCCDEELDLFHSLVRRDFIIKAAKVIASTSQPKVFDSCIIVKDVVTKLADALPRIAKFICDVQVIS